MKILILAPILFLILGNLHGQMSFYATSGLSPGTKPANTNIILNRGPSADQLLFNIQSIRMQFYAGLTAKTALMKSKFFTEFGISYTHRKCLYSCQYVVSSIYHPTPFEVMKETEHLLFFPVNIGLHLGAIDITSGLRLITTLSVDSELSDMNGYHSERIPLRAGWQMSAGYEIELITIGIMYYGHLYRMGSGTSLHGQSLEIPHVPGQYAITLKTKI